MKYRELKKGDYFDLLDKKGKRINSGPACFRKMTERAFWMDQYGNGTFVERYIGGGGEEADVVRLEKPAEPSSQDKVWGTVTLPAKKAKEPAKKAKERKPRKPRAKPAPAVPGDGSRWDEL